MKNIRTVCFKTKTYYGPIILMCFICLSVCLPIYLFEFHLKLYVAFYFGKNWSINTPTLHNGTNDSLLYFTSEKVFHKNFIICVLFVFCFSESW
jgi:hypothetical protein